MSTNPISAISAITPDGAVGPTPAQAATPAESAAPKPADQPDPADFRLVIEDDKAAGSFVYKTIDRRTGEVVSQLPRQEILRLREAFNYVAGSVIKAKA